MLTRNWWALALRGILAILLGLAAIVLPGVTLAVLITLFGAYAVVDGVLAIIAGVRAAERHERWWSPVLKGLAGIAAGVMAFIWPALTALALLYLIAGWAIVTGVLEVVAAVHLHRAHGEWLLIINGVLSILFGLLIVVWPGAGLITLLWMIGVYAVIFGATLLVLAIRLRSLHGRHAPASPWRRRKELRPCPARQSPAPHPPRLSGSPASPESAAPLSPVSRSFTTPLSQKKESSG